MPKPSLTGVLFAIAFSPATRLTRVERLGRRARRRRFTAQLRDGVARAKAERAGRRAADPEGAGRRSRR
ncbi:hypothetical protein Misp01_36660 [Microtetraspora sp. NBRC 13810]|uniref:hypothetical protein n=1 Tax=Microtetraspora sp. NBRC 13810 TaxID=3030990 RepID=UPI0024A0E38C|nr:hypothetical protein [Microtetraspora sp. NBRC 13810]GLW08536.1 hypothetical protein Misp01_36660 [Microtetraspora sp. NBRC 13810]